MTQLAALAMKLVRSRHERRRGRQLPARAGRTADQCRRGPQGQASDRDPRHGDERPRQARGRGSAVSAARAAAAALDPRPHRGGVSEVAAARGHLAGLRHPRRNRRQPPARTPGMAWPDRPAVIGQDRNPQRHASPAQGRAGDNRFPRRAAVRHPQETTGPWRAGRPFAQGRLVRNPGAERLHLGARPASGNHVRDARRPARNL